MKYLIIIVLIWFSCASISPGLLYNKKTYGNAIVDSIIAVTRGDRFKANIKNFPAIIGENITIYIFGVSLCVYTLSPLPLLSQNLPCSLS